MAEVYQKALKISLSARAGSTTGEIMNLMSNDCDRLLDGCRFLMQPFWGMCQVVILSSFLIQQLGVAALVGVLGIALMPLWSGLVKKMVVKYK
jgi:ATP-binding cassette subfamily C (CFTR/MRP) protein 1